MCCRELNGENMFHARRLPIITNFDHHHRPHDPFFRAHSSVFFFSKKQIINEIYLYIDYSHTRVTKAKKQCTMSSHPIQVLRPSSLYIIFVSPGTHTRARALCGFSRSSSSSCSSLSVPSFYLPLFLSGRRHAPLIGLSKKMWKTTTFPSSLACPASPRNPRTIIRLCPTYPLLFCRVCHHCLQ